MSRIVFGSSNHWTSPYQVGSHAWARLFAGHGWDALYVSDPLTPWHWFSSATRERTRERFELWRSGGAMFEGGRLRAYVPGAFLTPQNNSLLRGAGILDAWPSFSLPSILSEGQRWGFHEPEILWLDSVRHAGWGRKLNPHRCVLRLADWSAGFPSVPASVLQLEKRLIEEADLVITSAAALEERVRPMRKGRPLCTIRNGVDVALWQKPCEMPVEYREIPGLRAVYVGALDSWFDDKLLFQLARALPQVSFVMIGQKGRGFDVDASPRNIFWLGSRSREKVPAYLQHAHVGLIPFKRNELIECVCPLKLYEYMAAGLPVVASRWDELERMKSPAILASGAEEWTEALRGILIPDRPAGAGQEDLRHYALRNGWDSRWLQWDQARSLFAL